MSGPSARKVFVAHAVSGSGEKETNACTSKASLKDLLPAPTRPASSPRPPSSSAPPLRQIANDDFFSLDTPQHKSTLTFLSTVSPASHLETAASPSQTVGNTGLAAHASQDAVSKAAMKLFGPPKRPHERHVPLVVKEIRQDDQIQVSRSTEAARTLALEEAHQPATPFGMVPSKKAKIKNNVMSLAYNVAVKEKELEEFHASSRRVKQQTRFKYGF